jgi:hypothetical protein
VLQSAKKSGQCNSVCNRLMVSVQRDKRTICSIIHCLNSTNSFPMLTGRRGLSGSAPCRWYINEDLSEINKMHAQYLCRIMLVLILDLAVFPF